MPGTESEWNNLFHNGMVDSGKLSIPEKAAYSMNTQIGGNHYKDMAIQPTEFILTNQLGFCEGNIIKYVCRHKYKGHAQDLLKARHYIDMLLESEYEHKP